MSRGSRSSGDCLPLSRSLNGGGDGKRTFSKKWVHFIPIVVIFCFFILWFFSYPVDLEVKDGRITEVPIRPEKPISLSETRVDMAFLTAASPPYASISHLTKESQTAAVPAGGND